MCIMACNKTFHTPSKKKVINGKEMGSIVVSTCNSTEEGAELKESLGIMGHRHRPNWLAPGSNENLVSEDISMSSDEDE